MFHWCQQTDRQFSLSFSIESHFLSLLTLIESIFLFFPVCLPTCTASTDHSYLTHFFLLFSPLLFFWHILLCSALQPWLPALEVYQLFSPTGFRRWWWWWWWWWKVQIRQNCTTQQHNTTTTTPLNSALWLMMIGSGTETAAKKEAKRWGRGSKRGLLNEEKLTQQNSSSNYWVLLLTASKFVPRCVWLQLRHNSSAATETALFTLSGFFFCSSPFNLHPLRLEY